MQERIHSRTKPEKDCWSRPCRRFGHGELQAFNREHGRLQQGRLHRPLQQILNCRSPDDVTKAPAPGTPRKPPGRPASGSRTGGPGYSPAKRHGRSHLVRGNAQRQRASAIVNFERYDCRAVGYPLTNQSEQAVVEGEGLEEGDPDLQDRETPPGATPRRAAGCAVQRTKPARSQAYSGKNQMEVAR